MNEQQPKNRDERGPTRAAVLNAITGDPGAHRVAQRRGGILAELLDGTSTPLADHRGFIRHDYWVIAQSDTVRRTCAGPADALNAKAHQRLQDEVLR